MPSRVQDVLARVGIIQRCPKVDHPALWRASPHHVNPEVEDVIPFVDFLMPQISHAPIVNSQLVVVFLDTEHLLDRQNVWSYKFWEAVVVAEFHGGCLDTFFVCVSVVPGWRELALEISWRIDGVYVRHWGIGPFRYIWKVVDGIDVQMLVVLRLTSIIGFTFGDSFSSLVLLFQLPPFGNINLIE